MQNLNRRAGACFWLLFLILLSGLGAVSATPVSADPPPGFLIENITVAGNRRPASAHIVVSESLLVAGSVYSEPQLRTAIYRIKRLPFVVDADFALEKGSERGRYTLVITIEESRPLFVGYDLETRIQAGPAGFRQRRSTDDSWTVGGREFVGSDGLVFATVAEGLYQAGYTRYNLFGRGSFLSVALASDHDGGFLTPSLSAGLPLTATQSLRATVSWFSDKEKGIPDQRFARQTAELDWLYDTTDDPIFPTRGTQGTLVGGYEKFNARSLAPEPALRYRSEDVFYDLSLSARRYWPISNRQSISTGVSVFTDRATSHSNTGSGFSFGDLTHDTQATLLFGHSFDLVSGERARHWGDLRLETTFSYVGHYSDNQFAGLIEPNPGYQASLRTGLVYRSSWGVVRAGLSYTGRVRG